MTPKPTFDSSASASEAGSEASPSDGGQPLGNAGRLLWSQNPDTGLLDIAFQLPSRGWSGMSFTPPVMQRNYVFPMFFTSWVHPALLFALMPMLCLQDNPGSMVPGTAIIGFVNSDGSSNVSAYQLSGRNVEEVHHIPTLSGPAKLAISRHPRPEVHCLPLLALTYVRVDGCSGHPNT